MDPSLGDVPQQSLIDQEESSALETKREDAQNEAQNQAPPQPEDPGAAAAQTKEVKPKWEYEYELSED